MTLFHYSSGKSTLVASGTTNSSGGFSVSVPNGFSSSGFYYIVATGGKTNGSSVSNLAVFIGLVNINSPTNMVVNELSTVAFNFALEYATPSNDLASIAPGAFSNSGGLNFNSDVVNVTTLIADYALMFNNNGSKPGIASSSVSSAAQQNLITFSDALAACINNSNNYSTAGISGSNTFEIFILTILQENNSGTLTSLPQGIITVAVSAEMFTDSNGSNSASVIADANSAPAMNSPMTNTNSSTAPSFTVTYNANGSTGGSVPVDSNTYTQGQTVTVLGNTLNLARTGYTFTGWSISSSGSGTSYIQGNTFAMGSANVVLYAKWTANPTYTITYNANGATGGSVPSDTNNYEQGATVTVLGNTGNLARTGYTFAGWSISSSGSGTSYIQGNTFAMGSANVVLYAKWTSNPTYTVTYNANGATGGSVPSDTNNYEQGATVTVLGNTGNLAKTGYTFAGWDTQADGSGTAYTQGQTFTMVTANVVLYAKWTANPTYTVTYNGNGNTGGSVPVDTNNYEQGATVTVLGNTGNLAKTGYTFAGWTQVNGGTAYSQGQTFTLGSANVTLYAKWTANPTYTVTYNGNGNTGGSVPVDSINYEQGQTVTVLGNTRNLVKTDYTFSDWNTSADGTGTSYTAGQTFPMGTANTMLYANWARNQWTVQSAWTGYDLSGIVWSGTQFVAVGTDVLTSPDGKTWTSQSSGSGYNLFSVAWSGSQFAAVGE